MLNTLNTLIDTLTTRIFKPMFYVLDNESSAALKKNISEWGLT